MESELRAHRLCQVPPWDADPRELFDGFGFSIYKFHEQKREIILVF